MIAAQSERSVLFITLDSCRYDTFVSAQAPCLKGVGPVHKAMAPGNFTYASHVAMFVGFTPGVAECAQSFVNPKYGKIFKMVGPGFAGKGTEHFTLEGANIIDGFKRKGYLTLGTAAMGWFNPAMATGRALFQDFERFDFASRAGAYKQVTWAERNLPFDRHPVFLFVNIGETHVPYYYDGAPWDRAINPCQPFAADNNAEECRKRQRRCVEYVDGALAPLLEAFARATIVICADHGDCWGEDGLWEHGISHQKVLEVPLVYRLGKV